MFRPSLFMLGMRPIPHHTDKLKILYCLCRIIGFVSDVSDELDASTFRITELG
jgi:hypothetical protein